ncbi:hypothetical protein [Actinomadura rugatobispora]|uniref:Beta-lactamase-related domain-containing protein n=1 Tax=Actinomadura rugatobispora TaxID=1994 RepID=A0ABW1A5U3_9ACTN|nr:hypothetical protein GCM10010200_019260 [Actinomadura rugatobispora]
MGHGGTYLTGFAKEIAEQVRIHHLLMGTSGLSFPEHDHQRIFHSKQEQHECHRQAKLDAAPGAGSKKPGWGAEVVVQIVEAVTGMTAHIVEDRWELGRGGPHPGSCTYWSVYPDTGWVGVVLGNHNDIPLGEIVGKQSQAITGASPGDGDG